AFVLGGDKGAVPVTPFIGFQLVRKILTYEAEKSRQRTGFQEESSRKEETCICRCSGFRYSPDRTGAVGNTGHERGTIHAGAEPGTPQACQGAHAEIGPRGAWLEDARQVLVGCRHRHMNRQFVTTRDFCE